MGVTAGRTRRARNVPDHFNFRIALSKVSMKAHGIGSCARDNMGDCAWVSGPQRCQCGIGQTQGVWRVRHESRGILQ